MPLPPSLSIALKEWASVCSALETGRQIILLRKGGIFETAGEFELENRQFLLFPTYLHQNPPMLKPEAHKGFVAASSEPSQVRIPVAGEVTDIIQLRSRSQMDALEDQHIWAPPLIDMRYNYRPQNPLYLLLVRAYRLPRAATIDNLPQYEGCKSWVPLVAPISTEGASAVLDDRQYNAKAELIRSRLG